MRLKFFFLIYVPDQYKIQQMCDMFILENCVPTTTEVKKCVIKHLIITLMHYNFFLNAISLKKICDKSVKIYL